MAGVRVAILRAAGTNCDRETETAWRLAGGLPRLVHVRAATEKPDLLDGFQIITIPGGFSYGDDIAAGRVFAMQIRRRLLDAFLRHHEGGGLILGVCNGLQVLVNSGLLPEPRAAGETAACTVTFNQPPGFQDRWVTLVGAESPCAFTEPGRIYELPVAHGEGRVAFRDTAACDAVLRSGRAPLRYRPPVHVGRAADEPYNPNGSSADIAGLCDDTGRIFGLMPHPERFVDWCQHPAWTSLPTREHGDGLAMFARGVAQFR